MKRKNNMVSINEQIVKLYRKMQSTGKTDERRMNWIQTLAKKAVLGKLPRWGNNMSNTVTSQAAEAFKKGFANQGTGGPITGIGGTALGTMVGGVTDAVKIPYQGIRNLYNAGADFYNASASDRNAIYQIYLNNIAEKLPSAMNEFKKGLQEQAELRARTGIYEPTDEDLKREVESARSRGELYGNPPGYGEGASWTLSSNQLK